MERSEIRGAALLYGETVAAFPSPLGQLPDGQNARPTVPGHGGAFLAEFPP